MKGHLLIENEVRFLLATCPVIACWGFLGNHCAAPMVTAGLAKGKAGLASFDHLLIENDTGHKEGFRKFWGVALGL